MECLIIIGFLNGLVYFGGSLFLWAVCAKHPCPVPCPNDVVATKQSLPVALDILEILQLYDELILLRP